MRDDRHQNCAALLPFRRSLPSTERGALPAFFLLLLFLLFCFAPGSATGAKTHAGQKNCSFSSSAAVALRSTALANSVLPLLWLSAAAAGTVRARQGREQWGSISTAAAVILMSLSLPATVHSADDAALPSTLGEGGWPHGVTALRSLNTSCADCNLLRIEPRFNSL